MSEAANTQPPVGLDKALKPGTTTTLQKGEVAGATINVTVDMSSGSVLTTVILPDGTIAPIENVIALTRDPNDFTSLLRSANIIINLSDAPVGSETVKLGDLEGKVPDYVFNLISLYSDTLLNNLRSFALAQPTQTPYTTYTETFKESNANLSQGGDAHTTTVLGNNLFGNKGDDLFIIEPTPTGAPTSKSARRSFITLGEGNDTAAFTNGALRQAKSFVKIADFKSKKDTIALDINKGRVEGIGTKTLEISTKKGDFVIKSGKDSFSKRDIDFI